MVPGSSRAKTTDGCCFYYSNCSYYYSSGVRGCTLRRGKQKQNVFPCSPGRGHLCSFGFCLRLACTWNAFSMLFGI